MNIRLLLRFFCCSFVFLYVLFCHILISCTGNTSATDVIEITKVNHFITSDDRALGITATASTLPAVMISHEKHSSASIQCKTCHHKQYNAERIKTCSFCHKGNIGAEMYHNFCINCHALKHNRPITCNQCHKEKSGKRNEYNEIKKIYKKTFSFTENHHSVHSKTNIQCIQCHHNTKNNTKPESCNNCHTGHSKMVVLHNFCKDCHKKQDISISCEQCHKGTKTKDIIKYETITLKKTGHRLPPIKFNHKAHIELYNTECIDCHHIGSLQKCSACHTKKDNKEIINLRSAFHQQCHECHRRIKGPLGCLRCHYEKVSY